MLTFSAQTRTANLARMAEDRFDVLVIGGGITGAVARNFPGVTERDVVASWAGLRPLLSQDEELGDARRRSA